MNEMPRLYVDEALEAVETHGLLMESDAALPCIVRLIVGEPVRGSWWGHPRGGEIYHTTIAMLEQPNVLVTRLISGKITFVRPDLWPAVLGVGLAREPWQMARLSDPALLLLEMVEQAQELRTDGIPRSWAAKPVGETLRELERRLLVASFEAQTERNQPTKRVETWTHFADRQDGLGAPLAPAEGKRLLSAVLAELNERFEGNGKLPWPG